MNKMKKARKISNITKLNGWKTFIELIIVMAPKRVFDYVAQQSAKTRFRCTGIWYPDHIIAEYYNTNTAQ